MGSKFQTILLLVLTLVLTVNLLITVPLLQQTSATLDKILAELRADQPDPTTVARADTADQPDTTKLPIVPDAPTPVPSDPDPAIADNAAPPSDAAPTDRAAAPLPAAGHSTEPSPDAVAADDASPRRTPTPSDPDRRAPDPPRDPDPADVEPRTDTGAASDSPDPRPDPVAAARAAAEKRKAQEAAARRARIWADYGPTVTRIMKDLLNAPAKSTQQRFSPRYARDVPLETTSQFLAGLRAEYGRFQKLTSYEVIPSLEPGIHAFKARAKTDTGTLSMTVTLNARKEIVGIYAQ